jgi:hypothetical protein
MTRAQQGREHEGGLPVPIVILATLLVVAAATVLLPSRRTATADGAIQFLLGGEEAGIPATRIPVARPPWIDGDPLEVVRGLLADGDGSEARTVLLRFLDERGPLLVPPGEHRTGAREISPPWQILRGWFLSLSDEQRSRLRFPAGLVKRTLEAAPIDAASPLIWLDGLEELALRRLQDAIESGDRGTARLLLRRESLGDELHEQLREWVLAPPREEPIDLPLLPEGRLSLEAVYPLDLDPNPNDRTGTIATPTHRRVPLADLTPAVQDSLALLPARGGPLAVSLRAPHGVLWRVPASHPTPEGGAEPLRDTSWTARVGEDCLLLPTRTPRTEYRTTSEWIYEEHEWSDRGWTAPTIVTRESGGGPTLRPAPDWALEGFTIGGVPHVSSSQVLWLATRGFIEVETWVLALDPRDGRELWRTQLAVRTLPWHASSDLSDLLPAGSLLRHRDEVFAIARGGLVARLGLAEGDLRGIHLVPRHLRTPQKGDLARYKIGKVAALRLRPEAAAWVSRDREGEERLIALPPDGARIVALDLDRWELDWAHPAPPLATLHRGEDAVPWVIDLTTPVGEGTIRAWSLDPRTGALRDSVPVELEIPGASPRRRSRRGGGAPARPEDLAPIVGGSPTLVKGGIAVPVARGWAIWSRTPLTGGPPDRLLPWPEGAVGGTVTLLPADEDAGLRILTVHRQESAWGSRSVAELMRLTGESASGDTEER